MPETKREFYELHNEFDDTVIVCSDCIDDINDGVVDDREFFHSPIQVFKFIGKCIQCEK